MYEGEENTASFLFASLFFILGGGIPFVPS